MKTDILEELYAKYYRDALLYSLSLTNDSAAAEDLVSGAFLKALHAGDNDIREFKPWLLAVCRNTFLSQCRKKNRLTELPEYLSDESEELVDRIIRDDEYRALYRAIGLLQKDQKEVVILFYFENLPVRSIAQITDKREAYVKVLLYRARENLKKILR